MFWSFVRGREGREEAGSDNFDARREFIVFVFDFWGSFGEGVVVVGGDGGGVEGLGSGDIFRGVKGLREDNVVADVGCVCRHDEGIDEVVDFRGLFGV